MHYIRFAFHQFYENFSKIKILSRQKLYTDQLNESFSTFVFPIRLKKMGISWTSRKGVDLEKGGYDTPYQLWLRFAPFSQKPLIKG